MECTKSTAGVRKGKKKQVKKGELDRLKQEEKKKRRLEKALATSAAICSELEKKKQKKKEEEQKLDEEGAAIAEAVALWVLMEEEEEDSDHLFKAAVKKDLGFNSNNPSDYYASEASLYSVGWFSDDSYGCGNKWAVSSGNFVRMEVRGPCSEGTEISACVSSLEKCLFSTES